MACKLTAINGKPTVSEYREYLCDTEADIALLPKYGIRGSLTEDTSDIMSNDPCAIGSKAIVIATGDTWILSPSNEWSKIGNSNDTNSGSDSDSNNVTVFVGADSYLHHYDMDTLTIGEIVTRDDFITAFKRGTIYINQSIGFLEPEHIPCIFIRENHCYIKDMYDNKYYTAEYNPSNAPM